MWFVSILPDWQPKNNFFCYLHSISHQVLKIYLYPSRICPFMALPILSDLDHVFLWKLLCYSSNFPICNLTSLLSICHTTFQVIFLINKKLCLLMIDILCSCIFYLFPLLRMTSTQPLFHISKSPTSMSFVVQFLYISLWKAIYEGYYIHLATTYTSCVVLA